MQFVSIFRPESKNSFGKTKKRFNYRINKEQLERTLKFVTLTETSTPNSPDNTIYQLKVSQNCEKKTMNLTYITNKILVVKVDHGSKQEHDKILCSLSNHYGKHLKIFYLSVRSSIENPQKDTNDSLSSLPHLMPFLNEIYQFLTNVRAWIRKSKKNVILIKYAERTCHLLEAVIRFIIINDEVKDRFHEPESVVLSAHEKSALLFYEKFHLQKFISPSLKRYLATVSNIFYGNIPHQSNPKNLHFLTIRYLSPEKNIDLINENSQRIFDGSLIFTIYQNFHLIYTSYTIHLNEDKETDKLIYVIEPALPINGDILIIASSFNKLGFQQIYFRVQFHTCWLHGDTICFKNCELDLSKDFLMRSNGLMELHFKAQRKLVKEHENMLLSRKYFVIDQTICVQDLYSRLNVLEYLPKNHNVSYKAGPLDGSLYTSITKSMKTSGDNDKSNGIVQRPVISKNFKDTENESFSILNKFNILEMELLNAGELLCHVEKPHEFNSTKSKKAELKQNTIMPSHDLQSNKEIEIKESGDKHVLTINKTNKNNVDLSCAGQIYRNNKLNFQNKIDPIYDNANLQKNMSNDSYNSNIKEMVTLHLDDQIVETKDNSLFYDNLLLNQSDGISKVYATQHLWYKSNFTRENAILYLLNKSIGYFVIRPSTSLWKSVSIALKFNISKSKIDINEDAIKYIRHFIIDINTEGYRIRGFTNEKYYTTLSMLVYDHVNNIIGLPCKLILPDLSYESKELNCYNSFICNDKYLSTSIRNDFNVIYLGSFILRNIFDNSAISLSIDKLQKTISDLSHQENNFTHTKMSLKISTDRIIFTESKMKMSPQKYCKLTEIICCDIDPKGRVWRTFQKPSKNSNQNSPICGILSCLTDNEACCQLFCTINCNSEEFCIAVKYATNNLMK